MLGSVIFHNPGELQVSPAVRGWSRRSMAKVVVEYLRCSVIGNDVHDACADFVRWLSLQSPASGLLTFGIVNLPGLPWAGAEFDYWDWYERVTAEVGAWTPPPVLVDVEYLSVTHRGKILWPPRSRRRKRAPDRRPRPPGEPFPMGWYGQGLEGYRPGENTYDCFPPGELPPIPVPLTGTYGWLRSAPELAGSIAADSGTTAEALGKLFASALVRLPREFVEFFRSPDLWRRIRSSTDCYLHLDGAACEIRGGSGRLVRFLSDSQYCKHWCLHISPCGTRHSVVVTYFYTGSDFAHPRGGLPHPRDITTCAASFEEFVYRFWIENELWRALNGLGEMPVGGQEYLAFYDAKNTPS